MDILTFIFTISIAIAFIKLISIAKTRFNKFSQPMYKYEGEYNYTRLGNNNEFFTEWMRFKSKGQENSSNNNKKRLVILFFCGNPGYIRFYDRFLLHLSQRFNQAFDVIGVGQAGQTLHQGVSRKYFTLTEQVAHKAAFFAYLQSLPEYQESRFVFIGHSFGCYTALKLMHQIPCHLLLQHALFIHPAFDRIVDTPNGRNWVKLHSISFIFKSILRMIALLLSVKWRRVLASIIFSPHPNGEGVDDCIETLASWLGDSDLSISLFDLTLHQFVEIQHIDEDEIQKYSGKITVSYAQVDNWTPKKLKDDFKQRFSQHVVYHECLQGISHSFVAGASHLQADQVLSLLQNKILSS